MTGLILGIESSCDETAAAVVRELGRVVGREERRQSAVVRDGGRRRRGGFEDDAEKVRREVRRVGGERHEAKQGE